jgi:hypothetical protein
MLNNDLLHGSHIKYHLKVRRMRSTMKMMLMHAMRTVFGVIVMV